MAGSKKEATIESQVWGLTGGIASGKTTVAQCLESLGGSVIYADRIGAALRQKGGRAHSLLIRKFGTADTEVLRERTFSDLNFKAELEGLLHPLILEESLSQMKEALQGAQGPVFYESPLLIEKGRASQFRGLIVVLASTELRLQRLLTRSGMTSELARRILQTQATDAERRKQGTYILENQGSLPDLQKATQELYKSLKY